MIYIANVGKDAEGPMFFNLGASVGKGGTANGLSDDVQLVQFFLSILGFYTYRGSTETYSGHNDDETAAAILAYQKARPGLTQDGRVNVAQGLTFAKGSTWTIIKLNQEVRLLERAAWPRMMDFSAKKPPPMLFNRVARLLGTGASWIVD